MNPKSRLADFIQANVEEITDAAQAFAETRLSHAVHLDAEALRDHIPQVLETIVHDLRTLQTSAEQLSKSQGGAEDQSGSTSAARSHGRLRAKSGFNIDQMVAEYRALRASVLQLWAEWQTPDETAFDDMLRFNEAIDQAIAESVADFSQEAESWRQVFLGVLGHDLRGPLSAIMLTSDLMAQMTRDTPLSKQTDRLIRSGKRMNDLLDDLLDYSRTSLGMGIRIVRKQADLVPAIEEEIDLLRAALPDVVLELDAGGPATGNFDVSRIREALGNLVANAAKYGPTDGVVRVALKQLPDQLQLSVENDGQISDTRVLETMFEPLKRGTAGGESNDRNSLGLGLFIVREIAKAHGGTVTAKSANGRTLVTLHLPR